MQLTVVNKQEITSGLLASVVSDTVTLNDNFKVTWMKSQYPMKPVFRKLELTPLCHCVVL